MSWMKVCKIVVRDSVPLIVVFLLGIAYQDYIVPDSDFKIIFNTSSDQVSQDSSRIAGFSIVDTSPIMKTYDYDIALAAGGINEMGLPDGIKSVNFMPPYFSHQDKKKIGKMIIKTDKDIDPGNYVLKISGYGANGIQRSAFFVINIEE
jgi:hypothetical protein